MLPKVIETSIMRQFLFALYEGNEEHIESIVAQGRAQVDAWMIERSTERLNLPVAELDLPKFVRKALAKKGIKTLGEILKEDWPSRRSRANDYLSDFVRRHGEYLDARKEAVTTPL